MPKVKIKIIRPGHNDIYIEAAENATIYQILQSAGVFVDAPCGGNGRCGKCKVKISGQAADPGPEERRLLSAPERSAGIRLACLCRVAGDVTVEILDQGGMDVVTRFGRLLPSVTENRRGIGLAVDIGTTTIAAYFYDLQTGEQLDVRSDMNEQRKYGADVISRIDACDHDPAALVDQKNLIVSQINGMIDGFLSDKQCGAIQCAVIAGNTTMLHLLEGLNPSGIARSPFTPESLFGLEFAGDQLGLHIAGPVYLAPCVSAYVGGDVTAGIVGCGIDQTEDTILYIDVGTNGETALFTKGTLYCCSTAAGPAFEGAQIQYGMGSIPGAVDRVWLQEDDIRRTTIGGEGKPAGICGSGLLSATACMLDSGVIDESGLLLEPDEVIYSEKIKQRITEDGFVLDELSGLVITQKDIREVQLAKSAIAAGIACLLHFSETDAEKIDRVLIAGGFGAHIDPSSAARIGLIPASLRDKFEAVGNAAGLGASAVLLNEEVRGRLEKLPKICRYIELSGNAYFNDQYVDHMLFPT